jgi:hypothetical protein
MKKHAPRRSNASPAGGGVIYKTVCENPGCGFGFDLRINRTNIGLLGRHLACPRCRRPGGSLKRDQRLGDRLFSSRLQFRNPRAERGLDAESEPEGVA